MKHEILNATQIQQKLKRMAYQIYENNFQASEIVFVGLQGAGYTLATKLRQEFVAIAPIATTLGQVFIDKAQPTRQEVTLDLSAEALHDKTVIVVDDVLYTGRTLIYSLKPFLKAKIFKLQTAVLIQRNHRLFPIATDYVGYSLATTLQEHILVTLEGEQVGVYMS